MSPHNPVALEVSDKLDAAIAGLAELEAQTDGFAVAAVQKKQGAEQKLSAHRKRIRDTETSIEDFRLLLKVAERTDARAASEAKHEHALAELAEFECLTKVKNKAVADFCKGAEMAQKAFLVILEANHRLSNALPRGCRFPPGVTPYSGEAVISGKVFPATTDILAAAEMYRHSGISDIGQTGAMPGARALSHEVLFNADQTEPWSESTARMNGFLLSSLRDQIETAYRFEIEQLEKEPVNG